MEPGKVYTVKKVTPTNAVKRTETKIIACDDG